MLTEIEFSQGHLVSQVWVQACLTPKPVLCLLIHLFTHLFTHGVRKTDKFLLPQSFLYSRSYTDIKQETYINTSFYIVIQFMKRKGGGGGDILDWIIQESLFKELVFELTHKWATVVSPQENLSAEIFQPIQMTWKTQSLFQSDHLALI